MRDVLEALRAIRDLPPGNTVVQSLALLGLSTAYEAGNGYPGRPEIVELAASLARIHDPEKLDRALDVAVRTLEERVPAPRPAPGLRH